MILVTVGLIWLGLVFYSKRGKAKTEAEFTAKSVSCVDLGHPLIELHCDDLDGSYHISWICDNCNQKFMRSDQPRLLHCRACRTDFCNDCKPVPDSIGLTASMTVEPSFIAVCFTNMVGSIVCEKEFGLESTVQDLEAEVRNNVKTHWIRVSFLSDDGTGLAKSASLKAYSRLALKGDVRGHVKDAMVTA